jgi:hypothetical protein
MDINIVKSVTEMTEEGDSVEVLETTTYSVELNNGVFNVYITEQNEELEDVTVHLLTQPFKPLSDGKTEEWDNLTDAISWFKEISGDLGE